VPMTILCAREGVLRLAQRWFPDERSLGARVLRRLLRLEPLWFRPYPHMSADDLKRVFDMAVDRGLPVVTLMFHSSELMPGGSPYFPTEESIEALYERFDALFSHAAERGARAATLRDFAERYTSR
jgi:sugar phosphate isomerase/epimerase